MPETLLPPHSQLEEARAVKGDVIFCPPIITADGLGGVLPWLDAKRVGHIVIELDGTGDYAFYFEPISGENFTVYEAAEEVVNAALDALEGATQ